VAEAGSLLADVHNHFRWYYETGSNRMVTGTRGGAAGSPASEPAWPRFLAARARPELALAAAHVG
jgi:hypothetical protein